MPQTTNGEIRWKSRHSEKPINAILTQTSRLASIFPSVFLSSTLYPSRWFDWIDISKYRPYPEDPKSYPCYRRPSSSDYCFIFHLELSYPASGFCLRRTNRHISPACQRERQRDARHPQRQGSSGKTGALFCLMHDCFSAAYTADKSIYTNIPGQKARDVRIAFTVFSPQRPERLPSIPDAPSSDQYPCRAAGTAYKHGYTPVQYPR